MPGRVITFYSYKGGVGRTFAMANIGVILAQWGFRVLVVDWDIEAPGLSHYFSEFAPQPRTGVLNYVLDCRNGVPRDWRSYTVQVDVPGCPQGMHLMPAATEDDDYTRLVQSLDWDELYTKHAFGSRIEELRSAWVDNFDFVLIDSRTGVTDFSGLTTVQLPDVLAFMFTANVQSLEGCCRIAERAMAARRNLPIDRPALVPLPLVAKFEQREEYDRAQQWRSRFNERLRSFLDVWIPRTIKSERLVDLLTVPYVPRWNFGEDLAACIEPHDPAGVRSASTAISYTLETIASILANDFKKIDLLSSSRDEYVLKARAEASSRKSSSGRKRVFISYTRPDYRIADQLHAALSDAYFDSWVDRANLSASEDWQSSIQRNIDESNAMIVVIGPTGPTPLQENEIEAFLRHSLRASVRKPIIPLVLPGGEEALMKSRLADFAALYLDPKRPIEPQLQPMLARLN